MKEGFLSIDARFQGRARYMTSFRAWDNAKDAGPITELVGEYLTARLVNTCKS